MSSRTRIVTPAVAALSVAAVAAVLAAAVGLGIWPPQFAVAAPVEPATAAFLGVNDGTEVALGPVVDSLDKFGVGAVATATLAPKALLSPVAKKAAPLPKVVAKPKAKPAVAKKSAAKTKRRAAATSTNGWSSAKCSTYGIGDGLIGNGMAGGGILRADSMVVAHRTLPFGTRIQFKYKGRTCTAVVQDRGPFIASRIFDLGPGTAKALKFSGVGRVQYKILGR